MYLLDFSWHQYCYSSLCWIVLPFLVKKVLLFLFSSCISFFLAFILNPFSYTFSHSSTSCIRFFLSPLCFHYAALSLSLSFSRRCSNRLLPPFSVSLIRVWAYLLLDYVLIASRRSCDACDYICLSPRHIRFGERGNLCLRLPTRSNILLSSWEISNSWCSLDKIFFNERSNIKCRKLKFFVDSWIKMQN